MSDALSSLPKNSSLGARVHVQVITEHRIDHGQRQSVLIAGGAGAAVALTVSSFMRALSS